MNLLLDPLPSQVECHGKKYPIQTDFRAGIRFSMLLRDTARSPPERFREAVLQSYTGKIPPVDALEPLFSFYVPPQKEIRGKECPDPVCDFQEDAGHIFSAFWEQYGIDLNTAELHWWKFLALFGDLSENTRYGKIMGYRSAEIPSGMPEEQKEFYREMKRLYALPGSRYHPGSQEADSLDLALMGDGRVSGLVYIPSKEETT